eukprot:3674495-Pleurochrysis_carterae.AAC.5
MRSHKVCSSRWTRFDVPRCAACLSERAPRTDHSRAFDEVSAPSAHVLAAARLGRALLGEPLLHVALLAHALGRLALLLFLARTPATARQRRAQNAVNTLCEHAL